MVTNHKYWSHDSLITLTAQDGHIGIPRGIKNDRGLDSGAAGHQERNIHLALNSLWGFYSTSHGNASTQPFPCCFLASSLMSAQEGPPRALTDTFSPKLRPKH